MFFKLFFIEKFHLFKKATLILVFLGLLNNNLLGKDYVEEKFHLPSSVTIYIPNSLSFYLLEKEKLFEEDIFIKFWQHWADINKASLEFIITDSPKLLKSEIIDNHLYIVSNKLPYPILKGSSLFSSSVIENSLVLIEFNTKEDLPIGLLERNYNKFIESPYFPLLKEKIKIFSKEKELFSAINSQEISGIIEYPFQFWRYPIKFREIEFFFIEENIIIEETNLELINTLKNIEKSFENIDIKKISSLLEKQKNFLDNYNPPPLIVGISPNYYPFSFWDKEEDKLKGLFIDYANIFFSSLGVPYKLVNIENEDSYLIDILWGINPILLDSDLSFYKTSFSIFSLKDNFNKIEKPIIAYEKKNKKFISSFFKDQDKKPIWKENSLGPYDEDIDGWLIENPRIPLKWIDNLDSIFYKNIQYEKTLYYSLEPNDKLRSYFTNNFSNLWKNISLSQWYRLEKVWVNEKLLNPYKMPIKEFYLDEIDKMWLYNNSHIRVGIDMQGSIIERPDNFLKQSLVDILLKELSEKLKISFLVTYASGEEELKKLLEEDKIDLYFGYNKEGIDFIDLDYLSLEILKIPLYFYTIESQITTDEKAILKSSIGVWDKITSKSDINLDFKEIHSFPQYNQALLSLLSKNTSWVLMDPFNALFFSHKFRNVELYPFKINEPQWVSLYIYTSTNKKNLHHLLEKSFFSYTSFNKELLFESWKNKLIQSPSVFYNFLILLPVLITLFLIIVINYNFFTRKLQQGDNLNKKLKDAERSAREANAIKNEFIANVSHELRTALNGIIGTTEILKKKTNLTKTQEEYFSILEYSSQSLLTIINDLLDVSRIENKRIHLENKPFLLSSYLNNLVDNIKQTNDNSRISILLRTFNLPNEMILGDPIRLTQILNNLIRNSIKFTETGFVKISVSSFKRHYKKVWIEFSIEDTGIGIAQDKIVNLFKPFSQAHDNLSVDKGGIGLGLYICQSFVSLMEGSPIKVQSYEGKGSSFYFSIPFQLTNIHQEEKSQNDNSLILILLDNPFEEGDLLNLLKSKNLGYKVITTPEEALNFLNYSNFIFFIVEENFFKEDSILFLEINKNPPFQERIIILGEDSETFKKINKNTLLKDKVFLFNTSHTNPKLLVDYLDELQKNLNKQESNSIKESVYFKNTSVLIVEDHEINQKILTIMLSQLGIEADVAKTGREAIEKFNTNNSYNLIFMDIQLPDKNGFEVTKEIRDLERKNNNTQQNIPIISITANAMHGYKNLCIERGLDDYLSKPILMNNLIEVLKLWLPREKQSKNNFSPIENSPNIFKEEKEIPYLEIEDILKNLNLSMEEYETILIKTYDSCYDKLFIPIYKISQERDENKKKELVDLLHGLSGVLGNIGSLELFRDLKNYEKYIIEKKDFPTESNLKEIMYKVEVFFNALKNLKREA